jgi:hypothetical protein
MPIVKAGPNQYLLVGRHGNLENRGSAVQAILMPGSVYVIVPSTKQEATFEFTQETRDGIPLRFKGIIIFRVTDPVAAARVFDFGNKTAVAQITTLLTHVCLGELRHAVSHMTMVECIEQRKTTLSGVAEAALRATIGGAPESAHDAGPSTEPVGGAWGISVEVAQVSQVFIVDADLRQQLEAEVRNEIRLKSDQSNIQTNEETRLAEMASADRVEEQKLAADREQVRREEVLNLARVERERRMQAEALATQQQALALEQERFRAEMETEQARVDAEAPVRLLRNAREAEILREELATRELQNRVRALDVERELLLARAQQDLRREILPLEQAPEIVAAASRVLQGTNLSLYGEHSELVGQLTPLFEVLARAARHATQPVIDVGPEPNVPA